MTDDIALWWGVKRSLIDYAVTIGAGRVEASHESVAADGSRLFGFTAAANIPLAFLGAFRLIAHDGMLDVRLQDPVIELGDQPTLKVGSVSHLHVVSQVCLAELHQTDDRSWPGFTCFDAALAAAATDLFADMYPNGTALAPIWIATSALD